jgi:CcmD family protein
MPDGTSDWPWVMAAYALTWFVLGSYALRVRRRLTRARAERDAESQRAESAMEVDA